MLFRSLIQDPTSSRYNIISFVHFEFRDNITEGFCHLQECLLGALGSKTVVYVTHQIEFLPAADLILVRISLAKVHVNLLSYIVWFSL